MVAGCVSCDLNARTATLPQSERVYLDDRWRVAHAWSSLPGWSVVVLRRHAESLAELTDAETVSLGRVLRATSVALQEVVDGCVKTYVMLFAEQDGHHHVHLHVVPRMAWFGDDDRAAAVFRYLNAAPEEQAPQAERDHLASLVGAVIRREMSGTPEP